MIKYTINMMQNLQPASAINDAIEKNEENNPYSHWNY
jgi:hypothetical protein